MKLNKIFLLAGIAMMGLMLGACSDDDDYTPGAQPPAGADGVYFDQKVHQSLEYEPTDDPTFTVQVARIDSAAAGSVNIVAEVNDSNVFVFPASVSFAAGQRTASFDVTMKDAIPGTTYNLVLKVDGDNVNPYLDQTMYVSYDAAVIKWVPAEGVWLGNLVNVFFGVQSLPLVAPYEIAETSTGRRIRMQSPYAGVNTGEGDTDYAYRWYPYNEEGDLDGSENTWIINIDASGKARISGRAYLGMDFGSGSFYIDSRADATLKGDVLTFPASSLGVFMAGYGGRLNSDPTVFYLTEKAYVDKLKADEEAEEEEE